MHLVCDLTFITIMDKNNIFKLIGTKTIVISHVFIEHTIIEIVLKGKLSEPTYFLIERRLSGICTPGVQLTKLIWKCDLEIFFFFKNTEKHCFTSLK